MRTILYFCFYVSYSMLTTKTQFPSITIQLIPISPSSPSLLRTTIWSLDICICFSLIWFLHLVVWLFGWLFLSFT